MGSRQLTPQDLSRLGSVTTGEVTDSSNGRTVTVAAANPTDVVEAVTFAATFAMPLSVDVPGAAAAEDGVRVTTERLRAVHVDRVSRTAIAQVGALWSDVVD